MYRSKFLNLDLKYEKMCWCFADFLNLNHVSLEYLRRRFESCSVLRCKGKTSETYRWHLCTLCCNVWAVDCDNQEQIGRELVKLNIRKWQCSFRLHWRSPSRLTNLHAHMKYVPRGTTLCYQILTVSQKCGAAWLHWHHTLLSSGQETSLLRILNLFIITINVPVKMTSRLQEMIPALSLCQLSQSPCLSVLRPLRTPPRRSLSLLRILLDRAVRQVCARMRAC